MDQVLRMEHWHAGEILKRAVYEIEVIASPANAWVSMESRQHGILETLGTCRRCEQRQCSCDKCPDLHVYNVAFGLLNLRAKVLIFPL